MSAPGAKKTAGELVPGDVIELKGGPVEVLQEPFLGSRGVSLFDQFELFWRARVRQLRAPGRVGYVTWGVNDRVSTSGADR